MSSKKEIADAANAKTQPIAEVEIKGQPAAAAAPEIIVEAPAVPAFTPVAMFDAVTADMAEVKTLEAKRDEIQDKINEINKRITSALAMLVKLFGGTMAQEQPTSKPAAVKAAKPASKPAKKTSKGF